MKQRVKSITRRVLAVITAAAMCSPFFSAAVPYARAEAGVYITGITLQKGDLVVESLEESGYSMIGQPLNPVGTTGLYMGYQTGGESGAIRDLIVSADGGGSIEVEGVGYQKISDISLNEGTEGTALYLYASFDEQAGEPLRGLSFQVKRSQGTYSDDSYVLASDGSEVVITDDGKLADFDEGISDSEIYLRMYKGDLYRPYVDNVVVASAETEEAAIAELAAKRCTYYVNYDIGDEESVFVGYTRTKDEEDALRSLVAIGGDAAELTGSPDEDGDIFIKDVPYTRVEGGKVESDKDYTFYMTKDKNAGDPVIDLVACGYDPKELEAEETEEPAETEKPSEEETTGAEEPTESGESGEAASSEGDTGASQDMEGDTGAAQDAEGDQGTTDTGTQDETAGEGSDSADSDSSSAQGEAETVSERPVSINALGTLCVVGLDPGTIEKVAELDAPAAESDDTGAEEAPAADTGSETTDAAPAAEAADDTGAAEADSGEGDSVSDGTDDSSAEDAQPEDAGEDETGDEDESGDESAVFADAVRIYSEVTMKDWISGYFLRGGGQTASRYLYEESEYTSASESEDKLWISNIYCSSKKGKQFVNYIGYVSAPGLGEGSPFAEAVLYDTAEDEATDGEAAADEVKEEEADSTASVFDSRITGFAIVTMVCIALCVVIGSLAYKIRKRK